MQKTKEVSYWPMMSAIFLGSFLVSLGTSSINLALPFLMKAFNTNLDTVKWTLTGFMLAMGTMAPITAYLGERFSYKKIYLVSILGFMAAALLCIFSKNIVFLIISRIIQGAFSGMIVPATMSIIYQAVPKERQVSATSLWSMASMFAPAIGPTLSGFLIQYFSWQAIFVINIPIGIIIIVLTYKYIPYFKLNVPEFFDLKGFVAIILGSLGLLVTFSEGEILGWTSFTIIASLAIGIISLGIFAYRSLSIASPILDIGVFKYKKYSFSVIVYAIVMMSLYAGTLLTPLFLQDIQRLSALEAGIILLPASLCIALAMPLVAKLYNKINPRIIIMFGIILVALGSFAMSRLSIETSRTFVICWMIVRNVGISFCTMPVTYSGMSVLPKAISGHGSSLNNWLARLASSLSMAIFASLLTVRTSIHVTALLKGGTSQNSAKSIGYVMGINNVFFVSFVLILIALPFSYFLNGKSSKANSDEFGEKAS